MAVTHGPGQTFLLEVQDLQLNERTIRLRDCRRRRCYALQAAAGLWGPQQTPEAVGWLNVEGQRIAPGMLIVQAVGKSMEPRIPDGAWCLFRPITGGSREGKIVLVQLNTAIDPETGGRYTIKRYHSEKSISEDGWRHDAIHLEPLNKDPRYTPIVFASENEASDLYVVGEFVGVVG